MRDYKVEFEKRVEFIKSVVEGAHCSGVVYGNSGGKDCTLVGILCKAACDKTLSVMMPCSSKRNYGEDLKDALDTCRQFGIEYRIVDLTSTKETLMDAIGTGVVLNEAGDGSGRNAGAADGAEADPLAAQAGTELNHAAISNIAPRLRMTTLYAIGASENRLVAGTGNRSERYMGYFTKWGDGACDFNPIADLLVYEIYEFLEYLGAPESIIKKAPSAGLFDGQTDESEMGVSYAAIDRYIMTGEATDHDREIIERFHSRSEHKRRPISTFS